jgi:hypothetical protein
MLRMEAVVVLPFMAAGVVNPVTTGTSVIALNPGPIENPAPIVSGMLVSLFELFIN